MSEKIHITHTALSYLLIKYKQGSINLTEQRQRNPHSYFASSFCALLSFTYALYVNQFENTNIKSSSTLLNTFIT
ncbi:unnamed protein product [Phytomonas sp. EM1]|nr:unnamed protein product [Phytomonas sp. EM1]|eukprot:CCW65188.1 unnamed protein product [Phytomonas sp. isolate EM1]